MEECEVLHLDPLVQKYAKIWPALKYFQMNLALLAAYPFGILVALSFAIIADVFYFLYTTTFTSLNLQTYAFSFPATTTMFGDSQLITDVQTWIYWEKVILFFGCAALIALSLARFKMSLAAIFAILLFWWNSYSQNLDRMRMYITDFSRWMSSGKAVWDDNAVSNLIDQSWFSALTIIFLYLHIVAVVTIMRSRASDAAIIREYFNHSFSKRDLLSIFGAPTNIANSSRRIRTVMYCYIGGLVSVVPFIPLFLPSFIIYGLVVEVFFIKDSLAGPSNALTPRMIAAFFILLLLVSVYYFFPKAFYSLGSWCIRSSRKYLQVSLERARAVDPRSPILFLRPFSDDTVALSGLVTWLPYYLAEFSERGKTLDQLLLEEGSAVGPVIALGKPGDNIIPYGAARSYENEDDWKEHVSALISNSAVIIVCIDNTPGLWWEIEYIFQSGKFARTLFLLHPKLHGSHKALELIREMERFLKVYGGEQAQLKLGSNVLGFWLDEAKKVRFACTDYSSRVHYLLLLRWFLRSAMQNATNQGRLHKVSFL